MNTYAGLWIDHRKALIVMISAEKEETMEIRSKVEKHHRRSNGARSSTPYEAQLVDADDSHEREFTGHLDQYYARVIDEVRNANSILIFGPGEAKGEFKRRLAHAKYSGQVLERETEDMMTDRQIVAKVREHFHA